MNEFKIAMQTLVKYEHTSPLFCQISKVSHELHNNLNYTCSLYKFS